MDAAEREGRFAYEAGQRRAVGDQMRDVCEAVEKLGDLMNERDRTLCRRLVQQWDAIKGADDETA